MSTKFIFFACWFGTIALFCFGCGIGCFCNKQPALGVVCVLMALCDALLGVVNCAGCL